MAEGVKSYTAQLTPEEAEILRRPVEGEGGWQSLLRELQYRLKDDNTITLPMYTLRRTTSYARDYGGGGFEQALDMVLSAFKREGINKDDLM